MTQIDLNTLETALKNAVKPSKTLHVVCRECGPFSTDNGEWLLWCGEKEHAQVLLDAARAYLASQSTPTDDLSHPQTYNLAPKRTQFTAKVASHPTDETIEEVHYGESYPEGITDEELLAEALKELSSCYEVTDYPANGMTSKDDLIAKLKERLNK
jgi:hypothetical protein